MCNDGCSRASPLSYIVCADTARSDAARTTAATAMSNLQRHLGVSLPARPPRPQRSDRHEHGSEARWPHDHHEDDGRWRFVIPCTVIASVLRSTAIERLPRRPGSVSSITKGGDVCECRCCAAALPSAVCSASWHRLRPTWCAVCQGRLPTFKCRGADGVPGNLQFSGSGKQLSRSVSAVCEVVSVIDGCCGLSARQWVCRTVVDRLQRMSWQH